MKKSIIFAGLATVLTLAACSKSEVDLNEGNGKTVSLFALTENTKTLNDGLNTQWASGDELSVFAAAAGTDEYGSNIKFTISDPESGLAQGEVSLEEGENYDWYLFYPYSSYYKTPANTADARTYIGSRSDYAQKQNGYDSKDHLAGGVNTACFPLYGVAENVSADEIPAVTMKQIASVVAIKVKNETSDPIQITSLSFSADENIVGNFYIGIVDGNLSLVPYSSQVAKTAKLTVSNAQDLAAGEVASFYLGIKPFQAVAGSELSLSVEGSNGVQTTTKTLSSAIDFASGHIKTLNVAYTKESDKNSVWVRKNRENITADDVVVFVGKYTDSYYAMTNDKGTSSAPEAVPVTVKDGYITSNVGENLKWNLSVSENKYQFISANDPKAWLYMTNANNGVRVGTGEANLFEVLEDAAGVEYFHEPTLGRYLGIYNGSDWRCYTTINNNIKDESFDFYVQAPEGTEPDASSVMSPVETPTFDPAAGKVAAGTTVTISTATEGATIYYTTDGSEPTTASTQGNTVVVNEALTIKALAVKDGYKDSQVAVAAYTIQSENPSTTVWAATALADLQDGDLVVIVDTKSSCAMTNDNAASKAPAAKGITVDGDVISDDDVDANVQWEVEVSAGSYKFKVPGTTNYLYTTNANNGVRVGANDNNAFESKTDDNGKVYLFNTSTSRYIGVYSSQDWRCYTTINNNIKDTVTSFFVKQ